MNTEDSRLAKIQALLAKAESTTFPDEAKALTAKAFELMEKWSIDEAMIAAMRTAASTEPESMRMDMPYSPFKGPKVDLIHRLARLYDCRGIFTQYRSRYNPEPGKKYRHIGYVTIVGFPHDLRNLEMMYTSLLLQAQMEFQSDQVQQRMADECSHPGHRTSWRNSFQDGFNNEVLRRIADAKARVRTVAEDATPGTGLVLASKKDQVEKRFKDMFPTTKTGAGSNRGFKASAYSEGQLAGSRADVGGSKIKGASRGEIR